MIKDSQNLIVYHGSYIEVQLPDLAYSKKGKDFGKGFYVTTDKNQAIKFAKIIARREGATAGILNTYILADLQGLDVFEFLATDENWLKCVVGNRDERYKEWAKPWATAAAIFGKIADDDTARTINAYLAGAYGKIESKLAIQTAITMFRPEKLTDQLCLKTKAALKKLNFIKSEVVKL